jgi:hypothetical protein
MYSNESMIKNTVKAGVWGIACALLFYIFLSNLTPWGAQIIYSMQENYGISLLGPMTRINVVQDENKLIPAQTSDITYFTTDMPFAFEKAKVRVTYLNPYIDQMIKVGYKDQAVWHYHTELIDTPILKNLDWDRVGTGPYLYQKNRTHDLVEQFLIDPPKDKVIGTYGYENAYLKNYETKLDGYHPAAVDTEIDTPLRGRHVAYVYLENEPFKLDLVKQDLNWYEDPDPMTIKVYKSKDLVYTATIADDGISDGSKKNGPPQEAHLENPGPGLPENGVYKIVIDSSGDTILKRLRTNLHKIVFEGTVSPVANQRVFPSVNKETKSTMVITKAPEISMQTFHTQGIQEVKVNDASIALENTHESKIATPSAEITSITMPQSDVVLSVRGYFAFLEDQYFDPSPYKVYEVKNADDLAHVDYLLTNYIPPLNSENGWQVAEHEFDIGDAVVDKGKLSWVIQMPGIKDKPEGVLIKKVEIELDKQGWKKVL